MQYWLYAFEYGEGNVLVGKYDTYEEAYIERDRLDHEEYEYADIIRTEWQKEPRLISSMSFNLIRTKVKRLKKWRKQ